MSIREKKLEDALRKIKLMVSIAHPIPVTPDFKRLNRPKHAERINAIVDSVLKQN